MVIQATNLLTTLAACAGSLRQLRLGSLGLQWVVCSGGDFLPTGSILARVGGGLPESEVLREISLTERWSRFPLRGAVLVLSASSRNPLPVGSPWYSVHGVSSDCFY